MAEKTIKSKIPVLVWGASGQAEVVTDILDLSDIYQIEAYVDDVNINTDRRHFLDKPLLSSVAEVEEIFASGTNHAIVALGDSEARKKLVNILHDVDFEFINAIHKTAVIGSNVDMGFNIIIKPGVIIDPNVKIGNHSYIGSGVTVGHHTKIGKFVNITGGSRIAGHVSIGDEVFIGTGTSVKDRISIGDRSVIGIGSVVVSDIPSDSIAKGVPAKID